MRKLLAFLFVLFCPILAKATVITVQSYTVPNYYGPATVELRLFLDRAFVTSDNKTLQAGSPTNNKYFQKVTCSVVGTNLTIAQFTIDSTTDGVDIKTAKYSAYFFNSATGQQIQPYQGFESFAMPPLFDTGVVTTWAGIRRYNSVVVPIPQDLQTYSRTEIDAKFMNIQGLTNPMTTTGDMITGGPGGSPMRLAGNTTSSTLFLTSTGNGTTATTPSYQPLSFSLITGGLGYTPVNKSNDTGIGNHTYSGTLTLAADPTQALQAATKQYVDSKVGGLASLNGSSNANPTFANDTNVIITTNTGTGVNQLGWSGTLAPSRGGLGLSTYATGDIPYANGLTSITTLNIGAANRVLTSTGSAPSWALLNLTASVTGTLPPGNGGTGSAFFNVVGLSTSVKNFTFPNVDATILSNANAVTAPQGGTGITSFTVGDILYANSPTTLAKLGIGGTNTVLHGGTTPSYSAVDIVADTTGTLTVAKGGSGATTLTGYLKGNGTSAFTAQSTPLPIADIISSPTTNGVHYSGASATLNTAAGTTGTVLIGNTSSAPSFSASPTLTGLTLSGLTQNSIVFAGASGVLSQNNSNLSWDNTNNRLQVKDTLSLLGSGSGYVRLKAASSAGNLTFTLPSADGSNGYSLVTDGAGNLSFANISGGGGGGGITSLNGLGAGVQAFAVGTSGSDFNISSVTSTHTFNIPDAGSSARGLVTTGTQTFAGAKTFSGNTTLSGTTTHGNTTTFAAGTTSVAPAAFQAGSLLTSPVAHSIEWDGTDGYFTSSGGTRRKLAYRDSDITGNAAGFTGNLSGDISGTQGSTSYNNVVPLAKGGTGISLTIGGAGTFLRSDGTNVGFSADGSSLTGLNATNLASGTVPLARISGLGVTQGAVGITSYALGDTIYSNGSNSLAVLAGNTTTTKKFYTQTGNGTVSAGPAWSTIALGDIPSGVVLSSTVDAAGGVAGLDGSTKLKLAEGQEVWSITDLTDYASTSGSGSTAIKATFTSLTTNDILTWNGSNWVNVAPGAATSHNLLSPTHTDTTAGTVTRGDVITGQGASAKWQRLAIDTNSRVLKNDGTDVTWGKITLSSGNDVTGTLTVANGGTNFTAYTLGDTFYGNNTNTLSLLAGNTTTTQKFLAQTGDGTVSAAPSWVTLSASDLPAHNLLSASHGDTVAASVVRGDILVGNSTPKWARVAIDSANRVLTNNGTDTAWGKVDLTSTNYISGALGVGNGGTGLSSTPTNGQLAIGNGTNFTLATLTAGTNIAVTNGAGSITVGITGQVGVANGGTGLSGTPTNGQLAIGNGTNYTLATITAGSGITVTNGAGSITIATSGGGSGTVTNTAGSLTANSFVFGNGSNDIKATSAATNGQLLIGSTGANPVAATLTPGTNIAVTNGAGSITVGITGQVGVANGGTGIGSGTSGGIPYFSGSTTIASSGALTANGVVLGGGAGAAPTSTAAGTANQVLRIPGGGGAPAFGAIDLSQSAAVTGTLAIGNGGLGITTTPANGALPIGNGSGYASATITAGTNISVTNGAGSITLATSASPTFSTSVTSPELDIQDATNGGLGKLKVQSTLHTVGSGGTSSASNCAPAGALVLGVVIRVVSTVAGLSTMSVGDGTTANLWGATIARTAGTTTSGINFLNTWQPTSYTNALSVMFTLAAGNFNGTGQIRILVYYIDLQPPTS